MPNTNESPPVLWEYAQTAEYLGCAERTLRKWTAAGTGPKAIRVGRRVRFRVEDVVEWLDSQAHEGQSLMDDATEAYLKRLLDEAPPLNDEQSALIIRAFTRAFAHKPPATAVTTADAA